MKWFLITMIVWVDGTTEKGIKPMPDYETCRSEMNLTVDLARRNRAIRWQVQCESSS